MVLWTAFQVAACSDIAGPNIEPPDTEKPPVEAPDTTMAITSVGELAPGATVTVLGRNLDRLETLAVDGVDVSIQRVSDGEVRFEMPETAACDVDGRPVPLVANGSLELDRTLRIRHALRLEVGESRHLTIEDLHCLQIAGGAEDYLFTVNNVTRERVRDQVLTVQNVAPGSATVGQDGANLMASPVAAGAVIQEPACQHAHEPANAVGASPSTPAAAMLAAAQWQPVLFDDYQAAAVGDTVTLVNWSGGLDLLRAERKEDVPTIQAVVVGATEGHLLVADLRAPEFDGVLDNKDAMGRFQRAADLAEAYTTRALRAVIDPAFEMPDGAGGRMITVFDHGLRGGTAIGGVDAGEIAPSSRWGGDFFRARLSPVIHHYTGERIASVLIHEAAHLADALPYYRGTGIRSTSFYVEALAVTVEDMAARMHAGAEHQADVQLALREDQLSSGITKSPASGVSLNSPWGTPGSLENTWGGLGPYERGARILRYVQELVGEGGFDRTGTTLHQRLAAQAELNEHGRATFASFDIRALAREAGMSVEELLHRSMLADLIDDVVAPDVVARLNLPQTTVWDNHDPRGLPRVGNSSLMVRDRVLTREANVPAGTYAYWYIPAKDGLGYTLQVQEANIQDHHEVHLMRLR